MFIPLCKVAKRHIFRFWHPRKCQFCTELAFNIFYELVYYDCPILIQAMFICIPFVCYAYNEY